MNEQQLVNARLECLRIVAAQNLSLESEKKVSIEQLVKDAETLFSFVTKK